MGSPYPPKRDDVTATLLSQVQQFCHQHQLNTPIWVAISAGLDSTVLLSLMHQLQQLNKLHSVSAIHIHHGLHPAADRWQAHCEQLCQSYGIPLLSDRITVCLKHKQGLEVAARIGRYQAIAKRLPKKAVLLTGHHQRDQAETFLLQALRGAGVRGLASMPAIKPFGKGRLARPLLSVEYATLQAYAEQQALSWQEDSSNTNLSLTRNRIRHQVLPPLLSANPGALSTLARAAQHQAEANTLLDELAAHDLHAVKQGKQLNINALQAHSPARQRNLLRYWLHHLGLPLPSTAKLTQICQSLLNAAIDRQPHVCWPGVEIRRYRGLLFALTPLPQHDPTQVFNWPALTSGTLTLPHALGTIQAQHALGQGIAVDRLNNITLQIRFRHENTLIKLTGRPTQSLKKWMQQAKIPPWQRNRLPLLYSNDHCIAVIGYGVAEGWLAAPQTPGLHFKHTLP